MTMPQQAQPPHYMPGPGMYHPYPGFAPPMPPMPMMRSAAPVGTPGAAAGTAATGSPQLAPADPAASSSSTTTEEDAPPSAAAPGAANTEGAATAQTGATTNAILAAAAPDADNKEQASKSMIPVGVPVTAATIPARSRVRTQQPSASSPSSAPALVLASVATVASPSSSSGPTLYPPPPLAPQAPATQFHPMGVDASIKLRYYAGRPLACLSCHNVKSQCDDVRPCSRCVRNGRECVQREKTVRPQDKTARALLQLDDDAVAAIAKASAMLRWAPEQPPLPFDTAIAQSANALKHGGAVKATSSPMTGPTAVPGRSPSLMPTPAGRPKPALATALTTTPVPAMTPGMPLSFLVAATNVAAAAAAASSSPTQSPPATAPLRATVVSHKTSSSPALASSSSSVTPLMASLKTSALLLSASPAAPPSVPGAGGEGPSFDDQMRGLMGPISRKERERTVRTDTTRLRTLQDAGIDSVTLPNSADFVLPLGAHSSRCRAVSVKPVSASEVAAAYALAARCKLATLEREFLLLRVLHAQGVPCVPSIAVLLLSDGQESLLQPDLSAQQPAWRSLSSVIPEAPSSFSSSVVSSASRLPNLLDAAVASALDKALTQLHAASVAHGDLKPEHLYLRSVGGSIDVCFIDFDLAVLLPRDASVQPPAPPSDSEDVRSSGPGFRGNVHYASLAQHLGSSASPLSDCESMLYVFFEACTQQHWATKALPWRSALLGGDNAADANGSAADDPFGALVRTIETEVPSPLSLHRVAGQKLAFILGWTGEESDNSATDHSMGVSAPTDLQSCLHALRSQLLRLLDQSPSSLPSESTMLQSFVSQVQQFTPGTALPSLPSLAVDFMAARRGLTHQAGGMQLEDSYATGRLLSSCGATVAGESLSRFLAPLPDVPSPASNGASAQQPELKLELVLVSSDGSVLQDSNAIAAKSSASSHKRSFAETENAQMQLLYVRRTPVQGAADTGDDASDTRFAGWMDTLRSLDSQVRARCAEADAAASPMLLVRRCPCLLVWQLATNESLSDAVHLLSSLRASALLWSMPYLHLSLLLGRVALLAHAHSFTAEATVATRVQRAANGRRRSPTAVSAANGLLDALSSSAAELPPLDRLRAEPEPTQHAPSPPQTHQARQFSRKGAAPGASTQSLPAHLPSAPAPVQPSYPRGGLDTLAMLMQQYDPQPIQIGATKRLSHQPQAPPKELRQHQEASPVSSTASSIGVIDGLHALEPLSKRHRKQPSDTDLTAATESSTASGATTCAASSSSTALHA